MKLYVYDHCPYCVKARMPFGLKDIPLTLVTLLNDDEQTPIRMIGKKMVPILEQRDGAFMAESLDIIKYLDHHFGDTPCFTGPQDARIARWLETAGPLIRTLCIPRWSQSPLEEFATPSAIAYFTHKKEQMIGPFSDALEKTPQVLHQLNAHLQTLEVLINPEGLGVHGETLSYDDVHLFAALRSLSIVKGLSLPAKCKDYTERLSEATNIPLHTDLAV